MGRETPSSATPWCVGVTSCDDTYSCGGIGQRALSSFLRYGDRMKTCAQCGAEVTGRFCSSCGAATSEPVTVPTWAPTPVPTPLATKARRRWRPLAWTRNGYIGLGFGVLGLGGQILWLVGLLAAPALGGGGMLMVGIIGFRARNTKTATAGWWGVACAAVALILTVVGLSGAIKQSAAKPPAAPPVARFVAVDVSFDFNIQCHLKPHCLVMATVRNEGTAIGNGSALLAIRGHPSYSSYRAQCIAVIPWTSPGDTSLVECILVWRTPRIGENFYEFEYAQPGVLVIFQ